MYAQLERKNLTCWLAKLSSLVSLLIFFLSIHYLSGWQHHPYRPSGNWMPSISFSLVLTKRIYSIVSSQILTTLPPKNVQISPHQGKSYLLLLNSGLYPLSHGFFQQLPNFFLSQSCSSDHLSLLCINPLITYSSVSQSFLTYLPF